MSRGKRAGTEEDTAWGSQSGRERHKDPGDCRPAASCGSARWGRPPTLGGVADAQWEQPRGNPAVGHGASPWRLWASDPPSPRMCGSCRSRVLVAVMGCKPPTRLQPGKCSYLVTWKPFEGSGLLRGLSAPSGPWLRRQSHRPSCPSSSPVLGRPLSPLCACFVPVLGSLGEHSRTPPPPTGPESPEGRRGSFLDLCCCPCVLPSCPGRQR